MVCGSLALMLAAATHSNSQCLLSTGGTLGPYGVFYDSQRPVAIGETSTPAYADFHPISGNCLEHHDDPSSQFVVVVKEFHNLFTRYAFRYHWDIGFLIKLQSAGALTWLL